MTLVGFGPGARVVMACLVRLLELAAVDGGPGLAVVDHVFLGMMM